jgi:hypothetical protein
MTHDDQATADTAAATTRSPTAANIRATLVSMLRQDSDEDHDMDQHEASGDTESYEGASGTDDYSDLDQQETSGDTGSYGGASGTDDHSELEDEEQF